MSSSKRIAAIITFCVALLCAFSVLAQTAAGVDSLKRVDAKYTCFVTKHLFAKVQHPVAIEGKTYYGCCQMCNTKLKNDPALRYDTDPVSGNKVNKADAIIGVDDQGRIYFFENEQDFKKFRPTADTN